MRTHSSKFNHVDILWNLVVIVDGAEQDGPREFIPAILLLLVLKTGAISFNLHRDLVWGIVQKREFSHAVISLSDVTTKGHPEVS